MLSTPSWPAGVILGDASVAAALVILGIGMPQGEATEEGHFAPKGMRLLGVGEGHLPPHREGARRDS